MATPHINAEIGDFGKTVLMPGDPLRSKFIAENYLQDAKLVNNVRGVQGYTGTYKGTKVSVMASGMGIPSIGIYSHKLLSEAVKASENLGVNYHVGNALSSDVFYNADPTFNDRWARMGVLCIEMEAAALYMNAAYAGKRALGIFTVSDSLVTGEATTAEERQNTFTQMMEIALDTAVAMEK